MSVVFTPVAGHRGLAASAGRMPHTRARLVAASWLSPRQQRRESFALIPVRNERGGRVIYASAPL